MSCDQFNEAILQTVSPADARDTNHQDELLQEKIVIYDECGDSLWDAILEQEFPVLKFADIVF